MASPSLHVLGVLSLVGLVVPCAPPSTARACSGPVCQEGEVFPPSGSVPANAVVIQWSKPRSKGELALGSAGTLYRIAEGDQLIVVPVTNQNPETSSLANLVPTVPVAAGAQLFFKYDSECGEQSMTFATLLTVTAAAPLPSSLGTLAFTVQRGTITRAGGASCVETMDAVYADLTVALAHDAEPFRDVIRYRLEVDGETYASSYVAGDPALPRAAFDKLGGSPLGRGKDRIYTACGKPGLSAVEPGAHRVRMVGLFPDGSKIASDQVEVTLRCESLLDAGTGAPLASDAGASLASDARASPDARAMVPRGVDASDEDRLPSNGDDTGAFPRNSEDHGCSLSTSSAGRGAPLAIAGALLALFVRRRRALHAR